MSDTQKLSLILMAGACALPWALLLMTMVSSRQHRRELSNIEARLMNIKSQIDATRERLNLPK